MATNIAGIIADLLMRTCNATTIERQAFSTGSRYMVRFNGETHMEVHIVNRDERVFAEFWLPTYATPIMIIEYLVRTEPQSICREICDMVQVIYNAMNIKKGPEKRNITSESPVYHLSPP